MGRKAFDGFSRGVIVVTHDRAFLDRICTDILSFEGDGNVGHYADRTRMKAIEGNTKIFGKEEGKATDNRQSKAKRQRSEALSHF